MATTSLSATIHIDAASTKPAISRRLFGKFTEHLGGNVYLGAWAQVVPNPDFAPISVWSKPEAAMPRLKAFAALPGMAPATECFKDGFAPYWVPSGVTGSVRPEGKRYVQSLAAGEGRGQLRTAVYLPLHRVRKFEVTLKARSATSATISVSLVSGDGSVSAGVGFVLSSHVKTLTAALDVPTNFGHAQGEAHVLAINLPPGAQVDIARLLVFPADHMTGWDPEVVQHMRDARVSLLRFPGGNFVSGYHWADGVGPLDDRPVLHNPAWMDIIEPNHVGTDDWLRLCELVGCEPLICVNAGDGTPLEAREWIEYCNAPADTPLGARRAANGHAAPYNVKLWEIGNELYGEWQIGFTDAASYADRYQRFLAEMSLAGDDLLFIANGNDPAWNKVLMEEAGKKVRSVSGHFLIGHGIPADADPKQVFYEFMAYAADFENELARHTQCMADAGIRPCMAITELMTFTMKRHLTDSFNAGEMVWAAGITNAAIRTGGMVELITHSALLNHGGGLRKERGEVYACPVWWMTHLYGSQDGTIPVAISTDGPTFASSAKWIGSAGEYPLIDVLALLSTSGKSLSVLVTNRHDSQSISTDITLDGFAPDTAEITIVAAPEHLAHNTFASPRLVHPRTTGLAVIDGKMTLALPPVSLTRIILRRG